MHRTILCICHIHNGTAAWDFSGAAIVISFKLILLTKGKYQGAEACVAA